MTNLAVKLGAAALITCCACAIAAPQTLMSTSTDWSGGKLSYPEGDAEITAVILRLGEGETPPFHCHPVPTMGYVLRGEIEVETADGKKTVMREGDAVVEVMRKVHRGVAIRAPVEIIVFYAGAEGVPNTVAPTEDPDGQYCEKP